jgi:hypothetical protein
MRTISLLMLCAVLILSCDAHAASNVVTEWQGTYVYHGNGGKTVGGSPVLLDIALTITRSGDCRLTREGFQRDDELICFISKNNKGIDVLFKSYPDGKIENEYGVTVYKLGVRLFSLFPGIKKGELTTEWGKLKPSFEKIKRGAYFKRAKHD